MATLPLGKLGFYWRMSDKPNVPPNPVPDFVDFEFSFREEYRLLVQTGNARTLEFLETIYRENYNVGYLQEGHALAEGYGNDFIACLDRALKAHHPEARRISEVGSGGCYILKKLKERGFEVAAIDPSPIAAESGKAFGIEVIPEFYPAGGSLPKSDVIIHYDVLEHVSDPAGFIRHHARDLNPGGIVVFAVPDCTPYIAYGDVSMILHEHLNYFDGESLRNVVEAGGMRVLDIRPGGFGGVLYCVAQVPRDELPWVPKSGLSIFEAFAARVLKVRAEVDRFISEGMSPGSTLGCYVPLRAVPYLSMLGLTGGFRFFDDNPGIYGQFFDGFLVPVENMADLKAKPVSHLLILSFAFGDKIRNRINYALHGNTMSILCLSDIKPAP